MYCFFLISIRRFFSDTIDNKSDINNCTNIPLLSVIGHSDKATSLIVPNAAKSIIAESFRSLRTNIQYLAADKKNKIITVTSSVGGEGKTFITMNLASIFALSGNKTILIGGDLRKPRIQEEFNIDDKSGLSSYLIGKKTSKDIIKKTEIPNLDLICSGYTSKSC